jgi:hypothetical protein
MAALQVLARLLGSLRGGFPCSQELPLLQHEPAQLEQVLGLPRQQLQSLDLGRHQMARHRVGHAQGAQRVPVRS